MGEKNVSLKVNDLYNLSVGLSDLSDKEMPISVSLKIHRAQKKVSEELVSTDKIRTKIIEKYKEKQTDDGHVQIKKDKIDVFNKEINELLDQSVEIELNTIDVSELEGISVKPQTLKLIESILKESAN